MKCPTEAIGQAVLIEVFSAQTSSNEQGHESMHTQVRLCLDAEVLLPFQKIGASIKRSC